MVVHCTLTKHANHAIITRDDGLGSLRFSSDELEGFLSESSAGADPPKAALGCEYTQHLKLTDRWLPKRWRRDVSLHAFFRPGEAMPPVKRCHSGCARRSAPLVPLHTPKSPDAIPAAQNKPIALVECRLCGQPFSVVGQELLGPVGVCNDCSRAENLSGPKPLRGSMVWTHKTAPTLQIHGRQPALTPDDFASMRRR
jgi:hypothetical protein